jgi:hypothetical protein
MTAMDSEEQALDLRTELSPEQRTADMRLSIDPGFVHHRKIQTLLGPTGMQYIDEAINQLPEQPDWIRETRINHIYTEALLIFCNALPPPTLGQILATRRGTLFCSTEELEATPDIGETERAITRILTPGVDEPMVELHYSTSHIVADTMRTELRQGDTVSVVAQFHNYRDGTLVFHPLLMGGPWLSAETEPGPFQAPEWYSYEYFENFIEDVDEFAAVRGTPTPTDFQVMQRISEAAFKQCLVEILGDSAKADWGGETSDHFTSHLHLNGKRTTAAFLLKGPARFAPMGLNHLGKNNDQICRLAEEPAGLLVVQHCHDILPPVRKTLRKFAVSPGLTRRYCLIDGRDSLRLLIAYDKLDRALELS